MIKNLLTTHYPIIPWINLEPSHLSASAGAVSHAQAQVSSISTIWTAFYKCIFFAYSGLTEADTQEAEPGICVLASSPSDSDIQ